MQRAWLFSSFAITVTCVDFVDPALMDEPDVRERGVRLEVRAMSSDLLGSVYGSPEVRLAPAVCRVDLLESRPYAADRMHWHPTMVAGEPGDRTIELALSADPAAWLREQLEAFDTLLARSGVPECSTGDAAAVRARADEIAQCVTQGLARVRDGSRDGVLHDHTGLAELD